MMPSSVHQALADSRGIQVVWKNFLFTAAIAVVVTITMTWVGLLVINALLVLPGLVTPWSSAASCSCEYSSLTRSAFSFSPNVICYHLASSIAGRRIFVRYARFPACYDALQRQFYRVSGS